VPDHQSEPFDVFLSHAHVDADVVKLLGARLTDEGKLRVWLDQWVLVPGELWVQGLAKGLAGAAACAVCIGRKTPSGWFEQEIQRALNRQAREPNFRVIPIILPDGDPSLVDNFLELRTWVQFQGSIEDRDALHRLISGIKGVSPGRQDASLSKTATQVFTVPFAENPFFTGREEVLDGLEKTLEKSGIAALTGMGGVGKTQTAAQYAYRRRKDYPAVLWVRAESLETLFADLSQLATRLELAEREAKEQSVVLDAVKRWLLVLDNVEDYGIVRDLTVKAGRNGHHVMVTTQTQATGPVGRQRLLPMERKQGAELLLRRANLLAVDAAVSDVGLAIASTAREISDEVGGLPLALDQAGAYIEETSCGLPDYLELLRERAPELLERRGGPDPEHSDHISVSKTLAISFEKLQKLNPAAAELLQAAAFLPPDAIPEEIFIEGAAHFGPELRAAASDALKWNEAIGAALRYSLLERGPEKKLLAVHRLVQAVVKSRMGDDERKQWAEQVVRAVNAAFPSAEFENWDRCERLVPSAQACSELADEFDLASPGAARLLDQAGWHLDDRARYAEAEPLMRRALEIDEKALGPDHPNVAICLSNLAVLHSTNRLSEAEPLMRRAVTIYEKAYGADHPHLAASLNNLADLLRVTNRLSEAEPLIRRALAIDEKALGPDHPNVAIRLNVLALLLTDTNRLDEAEPLMRRALAISEKALGPDHPSVATHLSNLAHLLRVTNRLSEAEPLIRRALAIDEKALGPDHPSVAKSLNNLARLLQDTDRLAEAEPLMRRAVTIYEKAYGADHPHLAASLNNLARLLQDTDRLAEAEPLMRRALAISEKALGPDHPNVAIPLNNLATLLQDTDRLAEAEPLMRRALAICEKSLVPDHPHTIGFRNNLAGLLRQMGRDEEADKPGG
jgi:tetratricopeptide (TPR) repeat protein